jgi:hypothetical protein
MFARDLACVRPIKKKQRSMYGACKRMEHTPICALDYEMHILKLLVNEK